MDGRAGQGKAICSPRRGGQKNDKTSGFKGLGADSESDSQASAAPVEQHGFSGTA
jgi:hypothetical protein